MAMAICGFLYYFAKGVVAKDNITVLISLKSITKRYGTHTVVHDLSIDIQDKETVVLLGKSGCGKTTTLKMINRLIPFDSGSITVNNQDIMQTDPIQLRRSIGYVFQNIGLIPHFTIKQNLLVVPRLLKWNEEQIQTQLDFCCDTMYIDKTLLSRRPSQLSGGQKQRIGVGRALMGNPDIVLMDEPFGALDPITREEIHDEFLSAKQYLTKTIVFVTHDIHEAFTIADRICILDHGMIAQFDTKHNIIHHPANEFVEKFIGRHMKRLKEELA